MCDRLAESAFVVILVESPLKWLTRDSIQSKCLFIRVVARSLGLGSMAGTGVEMKMEGRWWSSRWCAVYDDGISAHWLRHPHH